MIDEETEALVRKAIDDELVALRQKAVTDLLEWVGPRRISPETVAPFFGVSHTQVYRWLSSRTSRLYLPQLEQVADIAAFIGRLNELREAWLAVLTSWRQDQNPDLKSVFFHPGLVRIVEAKDLDMEAKLEKLVKLTIGVISRELEAKK